MNEQIYNVKSGDFFQKILVSKNLKNLRKNNLEKTIKCKNDYK